MKSLKTQSYAYSTDCEKKCEMKAKATTAAYRKGAIEKILLDNKLSDTTNDDSDNNEFSSESKFYISIM